MAAAARVGGARLDWRVPLAFAAIYVVWGSTYLAIRYAVAELPPLLTAGTRHLFAGAALYAWARARGARATAREWRASVVVGALFFLIGHGGLHWAERHVPSGLAAVLVATEPIWIALLVAALPGGRRVSARTAAGLALGLAGVALLLRSDTLSASPELLLGSLAVLAGAFSWSVGILYSRGDRLPADPILRAGTTLLAGAALLLAASALAGEPAALAAARPSARALLSLGYLIVFGSLVTYTAYLWLLERCSPTLVATHTYANPAVAVLLGWAAADEPVTLRLLAAGALILLAILLVGAGERGGDRPRSRSGRPGREAAL